MKKIIAAFFLFALSLNVFADPGKPWTKIGEDSDTRYYLDFSNQIIVDQGVTDVWLLGELKKPAKREGKLINKTLARFRFDCNMSTYRNLYTSLVSTRGETIWSELSNEPILPIQPQSNFYFIARAICGK